MLLHIHTCGITSQFSIANYINYINLEICYNFIFIILIYLASPACGSICADGDKQTGKKGTCTRYFLLLLFLCANRKNFNFCLVCCVLRSIYGRCIICVPGARCIAQGRVSVPWSVNNAYIVVYAYRHVYLCVLFRDKQKYETQRNLHIICVYDSFAKLVVFCLPWYQVATEYHVIPSHRDDEIL